VAAEDPLACGDAFGCDGGLCDAGDCEAGAVCC
jgi:hypothetical protein